MPNKPPAPSDISDKFMLRLPDGMRDRVAALAKKHNRSMNAEIVASLEQYLLRNEKEPDFETERGNLVFDIMELIAKSDTINKQIWERFMRSEEALMISGSGSYSVKPSENQKK
jgi:plasmid stability protein